MPTTQRLRQRLITASEQRVVEFELAVVIGAEGVDARGGEREHPADVGGGNEVPGGAHDMRAQDGS